MPRSGRTILLLLACLAIVTASLLPAGPGARRVAAEGNLLENPAFQPPVDDAWTLNGLEPDGDAFRLTLDRATVSQVAPAAPGNRYDASVRISGQTGVTARLRLEFWKTGGPIAAAAVSSPEYQLSANLRLDVMTPSAPPGTLFAMFVIELRGQAGATVGLVEASLVESAGNPTPTPTPTPTPAATATPTPAADGDAGAGDDGPGGAPGAPTPTRTPTPTKTPSPTKTPTPPRVSTPRPTPTMPPTATPTLPPGSASGGLLRNGDFEVVQSGRPAYWSKVGGELRASSDAYEGRYAGCLDSDTSSTKWLYQAVPVAGGAWYEAVAWAAASGGDAFLRVTWYTSADGSGTGGDQADSAPASGGWTRLATGPLQAPPDARSARVRLMLRPGSAAATACFDDAWFGEVAEPPPTPTPTPRATTAPTTAASGAASTPKPSPTPRSSSRGQSPPAPPVQAQAAGPSSGSLRITEFMSDPPETGRDAPYEWVELFNPGPGDVDLAGWVIADAASSDTLPSLVIPAGGYAVVAGAAAKFDPAVPVVRVPDGEIGNGLGNTGDVLRLRDPAGRVVDELSFGARTDVFDPAPPAPEAGETLGLRDPLAEPDPGLWAVTLRPTPGEPNLFPARQSGAVAGAASAAPAASPGARPAGTLQVEEGSGGGSVVPWMVLGGLAGISVGMIGAALARPIRRFLERRRKSPPPSGSGGPPQAS
jgi:hypothetical protein